MRAIIARLIPSGELAQTLNDWSLFFFGSYFLQYPSVARTCDGGQAQFAPRRSRETPLDRILLVAYLFRPNNGFAIKRLGDRAVR